ncbi:HDOD domain-containing protein [Alteromonas sediminis]|uniref:HDOD domain-containing protein n=1 Tax=Alteromonas sediminis TaxID=2259342 RepID=A0A3N5YA43_9ALTE|nr:HDOD domain-containing protein [Alteromonas sediminis]RPJ68319.1 HDOD domain-containing protein [Alteromonas sediminis]
MQDKLTSCFSSDIKQITTLAHRLDIKSTFETAKALSERLIEAVKRAPSHPVGLAMIAQSKPAAFPHQAPFARLVLLIVIALQNRLNKHALLSLVMGNMLVDIALEAKDKKHLTQVLLTSAAKLKLDIASDALKIARLLDSSSIWTYLPHCRLTYWQWFSVWSICLSSANKKKVSWKDKLSYLFQHCPSWTHQYLQPLLEYPSLCPPATIFTYQAQSYTCLGVTQQGVHFFDAAQGELRTAKEDIKVDKPLLNPALWYELINGRDLATPFQDAFSVTRPPPSLVRVLRMLKDAQVDIDKLAKAVENEPSFTEFVKQTASQGNRMGLAVTSVKQGIMTHGLERLGDMLITHALLNRFGQSEYPLKSPLMRFVSLQMMVCSELAVRSGVSIPQTAALVTLLANSALFTYPSLKTQTQWRIAKTPHFGFSIDALINGCPTGTFEKSAITLAKAWALPPRLTKQVSQFCRGDTAKSSPLTSLLQLTLLWAVQIQQGTALEASDDQEEAKAMQTLSMQLIDKHSLIFDCSEHLFCPLSKH